jgi:hypothetical protein
VGLQEKKVREFGFVVAGLTRHGYVFIDMLNYWLRLSRDMSELIRLQ